MLTRRKLLRNIGLGAAVAGLSRYSFAMADTEARLVLVVLRGAVDGLALAAPFGDGSYEKLRGELAIAMNAALLQIVQERSGKIPVV